MKFLWVLLGLLCLVLGSESVNLCSGPADADFIVVGSGIGGSVATRRLVDAGYSVILLEKGLPSTSGPFLFDIPIDTRIPKYGPHIFGPYIDMLFTVPQPHLGNTSYFFTNGIVQGGGTSVNGMIYVRGDLRDFDDFWPAGWSASDMLPFYKKMENATGVTGAGADRGFSGPLTIEEGGFTDGLEDLLLESAENMGVPIKQDINTGEFKGAVKAQFARITGERGSAYTSYLVPILSNPLLQIRTLTEVDTLIFPGNQGKVARGVFAKNHVTGTTEIYCSQRGVILSAGTIQTPAILMRSGIGPADYLASIGVDPLVNNTYVGANLQDHLGMTMLFVMNYNPFQDPIALTQQIPVFLENRTGMYSISSINGLVFTNLSGASRVNWAIQMVQGFSLVLNLGFPPLVVQNFNMETHSVGQLWIDAQGQPIIDPHYVEDPTDLDVMAEGVEFTRNVILGTPMNSRVFLEIFPGFPPGKPTREQMRQLLINSAAAGSTVASLHWVGTTSLGTVVNATNCRVLGLEKLYVLDAGLMPKLPRSNTMVPTYAVSERGIELILQSLSE